MLFLLGFLGILQSSVLPGAIVLLWARLEVSIALKIAVGFSISLLANWALVLLLVLCHLYSRNAILIIVALEILTIFILLLRQKKKANGQDLYSHRRVLNENPLKMRLQSSQGTIISYFLLGIILFAFGSLAAKDWFGIGTFVNWDSLVSWNTWASEWAKGKLPSVTMYYPQLLPANWSIPYVLLERTDLAMFGFASWILFVILPIFVLIDISLDSERVPVAVAMGIGFFWLWTRSVVGYADLPIASLFLVSWGLWNRVRNVEEKLLTSSQLWFVILSAATLAATKQAGYFWLFTILPWIWFGGTTSSLSVRRKPILWIGGAILTASIVAWEVYAGIGVLLGTNLSEVGYVTSGIYAGKDLWHRALTAVQNYPELLAIFVILSAGWFFRNWRVITGVGQAFLIIWAFFFSYDDRNASLGFGISIVVLAELLGYVFRNRSRSAVEIYLIGFIKKYASFLIFFGILLLAFLGGIAIDNSKVAHWQENKTLNIGYRELNKAVLFQINKNPKPIITDYYFLQFQALPAGATYIFTPASREPDDDKVLVGLSKSCDNLDAFYLFLPQSRLVVGVRFLEKMKPDYDITELLSEEGYNLTFLKKKSTRQSQ